MYRIGEFAEQTGLTPRALRFYEARGLLVARRDQDNQYRCYSEQDLQRAALLKALRQLGFSLDEIGRLLNALAQESVQDWVEAMLNRRLADTRSQMTALAGQQSGLMDLLALLRHGADLSQELLERLRPIPEQPRRELMQMIESFSITGPRSENEDRTLVHQTGEDALYLVADGTGGPWAGGEASDWLRQQLEFSRLTPEGYAIYLDGLLRRLNTHLYTTQPDTPRSAVCLSLLALRAGTAYLAHVGDTRIYRWQDQRLTQLTADHSPIRRLLERGEILHKDVPSHPLRRIIDSILGHGPEVKEIFTACEPALPGSLYLLVSDGVTHTLSEAELAALLRDHPPAEAVARIRALAERHGDDNASAIAVPVS